MAKSKKISSTPSNSPAVGAYSPSMSIDFDSPKEISGLSLGDKVRIIITGTVRCLEQREHWDDPKKKISCLGIKNFEAEIISDETDLSTLLDDDND